MRQIKLIFATMKVSMVVIVIAVTFLTDWAAASKEGTIWMYQLLLVLCSLNAIVFQREQDNEFEEL